MCSVVGYIGNNYGRDFVLKGLGRLEYRGYDSAGFACLSAKDNRLVSVKSTGRLCNLIKKLDTLSIDGYLSIGHTRWATHGFPSQENAHPHFDCKKKISIVHNGIIENHHVLRKQLEQSGHIFYSQTDTEVITHLFETMLVSHNNFKQALIGLVNHLYGAYAFIVLLQEYPDLMMLVRKRSPLCVGIGDGEMFVASDMLAFAEKTNKVLFLPDESFAIVSKDMVELYDFSGKPLSIQVQDIEFDWSVREKQGYKHYMLKEIYEQKGAMFVTLEFLKSLQDSIWDHIGLSPNYIKRLNTLNFIASGTSWHAARIAQFFFEQVCMIPTRVHLASEFRYVQQFPEKNSLYMAISQSGETADTLEALRMINTMKLPTITLTNVASSTMVRDAGGFLLTHAGPEVAVASTKAFSTQLTVLYWFAHRIALEKEIINVQYMKQVQEDLLVVAQVLENSIENYKHDIINIHAPYYAKYNKAIFLGRNISYPFSMEAALKLKEIAYIFSQCYPAGELKHGPLALIDDETPIFVFSHLDPIIYQKLLVNVQEVKARNGHIVAFAFEGQDELCRLADLVFVFPHVKPLLGPLAMTGLMQFFVYEIARQLGRPIDKPRNLAKSVTVE